jgi:hypothetical protein
MKRTYKLPYYLAGAALAMYLISSASAQPTYHWTAGGDQTSWTDPLNWDANGVPPLGAYQIFLGTGFPTTTPMPITIGASSIVQTSDSIFGPEWGETLNVYGHVTAGFGFFPIGAIGGPASTLNLYGNAVFRASDTFSVGDAWWFPGGPDVVINVNDNSQVIANWIQFGGQLNINGNGKVTANNGFNTGTATDPVFTGGLDTDATRLIDISGLGQLILPGDYTAQVTDWINRGIIEGNGVVGAVSLDLVSNPGHTIVTAVPEPASVALLGLSGLALLLRRRLVS